ncbi:MAG: thioesterase family protein [Herpetosiphon sp.]
MQKSEPQQRDCYRHFLSIQTRWMDNDMYGHVNNVVYYAYFDTVVNKYLIDTGLLDPNGSDVIGLVVETHCQYFEPLAFPEVVVAGLRVATIGRSSVRYEVALFKETGSDAVAQGHFIHVYVDRITRQATPLPAGLRAGLQPLTGNS